MILIKNKKKQNTFNSVIPCNKLKNMKLFKTKEIIKIQINKVTYRNIINCVSIKQRPHSSYYVIMTKIAKKYNFTK